MDSTPKSLNSTPPRYTTSTLFRREGSTTTTATSAATAPGMTRPVGPPPIHVVSSNADGVLARSIHTGAAQPPTSPIAVRYDRQLSGSEEEIDDLPHGTRRPPRRGNHDEAATSRADNQSSNIAPATTNTTAFLNTSAISKLTSSDASSTLAVSSAPITESANGPRPSLAALLPQPAAGHNRSININTTTLIDKSQKNAPHRSRDVTSLNGNAGIPDYQQQIASSKQTALDESPTASILRKYEAQTSAPFQPYYYYSSAASTPAAVGNQKHARPTQSAAIDASVGSPTARTNGSSAASSPIRLGALHQQVQLPAGMSSAGSMEPYQSGLYVRHPALPLSPNKLHLPYVSPVESRGNASPVVERKLSPTRPLSERQPTSSSSPRRKHDELIALMSGDVAAEGERSPRKSSKKKTAKGRRSVPGGEHHTTPTDRKRKVSPKAANRLTTPPSAAGRVSPKVIAATSAAADRKPPSRESRSPKATSTSPVYTLRVQNDPLAPTISSTLRSREKFEGAELPEDQLHHALPFVVPFSSTASTSHHITHLAQRSEALNDREAMTVGLLRPSTPPKRRTQTPPTPQERKRVAVRSPHSQHATSAPQTPQRAVSGSRIDSPSRRIARPCRAEQQLAEDTQMYKSILEAVDADTEMDRMALVEHSTLSEGLLREVNDAEKRLTWPRHAKDKAYPRDRDDNSPSVSLSEKVAAVLNSQLDPTIHMLSNASHHQQQRSLLASVPVIEDYKHKTLIVPQDEKIDSSRVATHSPTASVLFGPRNQTTSQAVSPYAHPTTADHHLEGSQLNHTLPIAISEDDAAKIFQLLQEKDRYIAELSESVSAQSEELERLRRDTATHEESKRIILGQCDALKRNNAKQEADLLNKEADVRALKDGLKRLAEVSSAEQNQQANALMEVRLEEQRANEENAILHKQIKKLEKQEARIMKEKQTIERQRDMLDHELRGIIEELKSLTNNAAASTAENQAIIDALTRKLSVTESELLTIQPQAQRLITEQQRVFELEANLREESMKNIHLASEVRAAKRLEEKLRLDSEQHGHIVAATEARISDLERQLLVFHDDTTKAHASKGKAEEELLLVRSQLRSAERRGEVLEAKVEEGSSSINDLKAKIESLRKDKHTLGNELEDNISAIEDLKIEVEGLQAKVQIQNQSIAVRNEHASTLNEEASELSERVTLLEVVLEEAESKARLAEAERDRAVTKRREIEKLLRAETEAHLAKTVEMQSSFSAINAHQSKMLTAAKAEAADVKGELIAFHELFREKESQLNIVSQECIVERAQFAAANSEFKQERGVSTGLRTQVTKCEEYIAVLEAKLQDAEGLIAGLHARTSEQDTFIEKHKRTQRISEDRIASLDRIARGVKSDQKDFVDLATRNEELLRNIRSLEVKLASQKEGLKSALEERAKQQGSLMSAQAQLAEVATESSKAIRHLEAKHMREVVRLNSDREAAQKALAEALDQQNEVKKEAGKLFTILKKTSMALAKDIVKSMRYTKHKGALIRRGLTGRIDSVEAIVNEQAAAFQMQLAELDAEVERYKAKGVKYSSAVGMLLSRQAALLDKFEALQHRNKKLRSDLFLSLQLVNELVPAGSSSNESLGLPPPAARSATRHGHVANVSSIPSKNESNAQFPSSNSSLSQILERVRKGTSHFEVDVEINHTSGELRHHQVDISIEPFDFQKDIDRISKEFLGCESGFSQLVGAVELEESNHAKLRQRKAELLKKHQKLIRSQDDQSADDDDIDAANLGTKKVKVNLQHSNGLVGSFRQRYQPSILTSGQFKGARDADDALLDQLLADLSGTSTSTPIISKQSHSYEPSQPLATRNNTTEPSLHDAHSSSSSTSSSSEASDRFKKVYDTAVKSLRKTADNENLSDSDDGSHTTGEVEGKEKVNVLIGSTDPSSSAMFYSPVRTTTSRQGKIERSAENRVADDVLEVGNEELASNQIILQTFDSAQEALTAEEKETARLHALESHVRDVILRVFLTQINMSMQAGLSSDGGALRSLPKNVVIQSDHRNNITDLLPLTSRLAHLLQIHCGPLASDLENFPNRKASPTHPLRQHPLSGRISRLSVGELFMKCVDSYFYL